MHRSSFIAGLAGCAVAMAGCAGRGPVLTPVPTMRRDRGPGAVREQLAAEQQRLEALFRGTPVRFEMQRDGTLQVTVPLRFSFDAGSAQVKPPLAAVLDRLAKSQKDAPTLIEVGAPVDEGSRNLKLATQRAQAARKRMVDGGVAASRFSIAAVAGGGLLRVVIGEAELP